ncbi:uncharacterized protein LOC115676847, partial [Syzygium oleosum]|uniref:uncharacterized protein LOC115676847 n=1 Tax=Syzygium oleosum TaxID=219896 RepID=UPI0024B89E4D
QSQTASTPFASQTIPPPVTVRFGGVTGTAKRSDATHLDIFFLPPRAKGRNCPSANLRGTRGAEPSRSPAPIYKPSSLVRLPLHSLQRTTESTRTSRTESERRGTRPKREGENGGGGGSDAGSECARHPNHEKLPGVCSSCLRERLSQLFAAPEKTRSGASSSFAASASFDSSSSSRRFSSASSSFYHSPPRHHHHRGVVGGGGGGGGRRHHRNASEAIGPVFLAVNVGVGVGGGGDRDDWGLRKSRSMAFAPEKKRGFWRRLLLLKGGGRSRKEEGSAAVPRRPRPPKEVS